MVRPYWAIATVAARVKYALSYVPKERPPIVSEQNEMADNVDRII